MTATTLPATRGGHHNKGRKFEIDPVVAEDMAVLLPACVPQSPGPLGELIAKRLRVMLIILYRTGLRCSEMLDLELRDLAPDHRALLVRHGKGNKQRVAAVDTWGWNEIMEWVTIRRELPPGKLICQIRGANAGQGLSSAYVRQEMGRLRTRSGLKKRLAAHQLRHGHAVELWHEGVDILSIQRQLGHARLDVTQIYLRGIDTYGVLEPISDRKPPMILLR